MFSQSVMSKTIRKSDGSYETTRVTQDSQGNKQTTVTTRTPDGRTETVSSIEGKKAAVDKAGGAIMPSRDLGKQAKLDTTMKAVGEEASEYSDRNIHVTKQGYAVPKNIW